MGAAVCVGVVAGLAGHAWAAPSEEACRARSNDTQAKLVECIQKDSLWQHLKAFQVIADANPDLKGHGNRNTGTPGYKASVAYVAGLMQAAGYTVSIQSYPWRDFRIEGKPRLAVGSHTYRLGHDWFVARLSGSGNITAPAQPVTSSRENSKDANSGCAATDFAGFLAGRIALLERGTCDTDVQVANAEAAGAAGVILYNTPGIAGDRSGKSREDGGAFPAMPAEPATIPVAGVVSYALGAAILRQYESGNAPQVHLDIKAHQRSGTDYNLIADSPNGDPDKIVVVDGHLDAIYGAGMLDNASGSTTMLEIALALANTSTKNRLRYIWFGGEELGLLGSKYYTTTISPKELRRIVFDIDADVTATPNYDVLVADPGNAFNVDRFPPNVVPDSKVGNRAFADYFRSVGIPSRNARTGNDGTDSNAFARVGVPNTGILTQQDCCKHDWEIDLWGGYPGNYEGKVPGHNGGCVDYPHRWCDNLSNNDPKVLTFVSKAVAAVTLKLANDASLKQDCHPRERGDPAGRVCGR
jgi:Zn-dependent M28 family amino/carboxypeptidase